MKVYTKKGDGGNTSLANGMSVSKADDRIELIGTIDELNSYIGHAKVLSEGHLKTNLAEIQRTLMKIMAAVADPRNLDYRMSAEETVHLEEQIDELEAAFPRVKDFVLYGGCELSARLDIARSVTRRAERRFRKVAQNYGADAKAMQYVNRLADYLYVEARFADHQSGNTEEGKLREVVRHRKEIGVGISLIRISVLAIYCWKRQKLMMVAKVILPSLWGLLIFFAHGSIFICCNILVVCLFQTMC